jgi:hypothetical protein
LVAVGHVLEHLFAVDAVVEVDVEEGLANLEELACVGVQGGLEFFLLEVAQVVDADGVLLELGQPVVLVLGDLVTLQLDVQLRLRLELVLDLVEVQFRRQVVQLLRLVLQTFYVLGCLPHDVVLACLRGSVPL